MVLRVLPSFGIMPAAITAEVAEKKEKQWKIYLNKTRHLFMCCKIRKSFLGQKLKGRFNLLPGVEILKGFFV